MTTVFFTAAHGGFAREHAPLGGGAAVYEHLVEEWQRTRPFDLYPLTPAILGANAPRGAQLTAYSEADYAQFSYAFEKACTEEILRHDPATAVVLANDISEGPDFATLAARGYRIFTIFHVDVVDYVTRLYFKGFVAPETTVRWFPRLKRLLPPATRKMAGLVWDKQAAVVHGSCGLILPSPEMREVVLRCYPDCPPQKIHVLPWGNWNPPGEPDPAQVEALRAELGLPSNARVILTLSRISPEKGQDRLLESLITLEKAWEKAGRSERGSGVSADPLWVVICGEAAYMQGQRHMARLRELAARLKHVRVVFPGHVVGDRKRAFLALAHIYCFPSRHESYGLTLLEAMAAGLPAVCCDTHGARSVMQPEFGEIVGPEQLAPALLRILQDEPLRRRMASAARAYAEGELFSNCAAKLAEIVIS